MNNPTGYKITRIVSLLFTIAVIALSWQGYYSTGNRLLKIGVTLAVFAIGAAFLQTLKKYMENPVTMLV